jgi:hypothetical protein
VDRQGRRHGPGLHPNERHAGHLIVVRSLQRAAVVLGERASPRVGQVAGRPRRASMRQCEDQASNCQIPCSRRNVTPRASSPGKSAHLRRSARSAGARRHPPGELRSGRSERGDVPDWQFR